VTDDAFRQLLDRVGDEGASLEELIEAYEEAASGGYHPHEHRELRMIAVLVRIQRQAEAEVIRLIERARSLRDVEGKPVYGWAELAAELGISRQALRKKYPELT
jgi:hypothetical protein